MRFDAPKAIDLSENDHQKQCVEYARQAGFGHLLIMIPNGMQLAGTAAGRARYMASLKAMGLQPGASDLFLAQPVHGAGETIYCGAFFEMKREKGRPPSSEQLAFGLNMRAQGYYFDVCYGFSDWLESLDLYRDGKESRFK